VSISDPNISVILGRPWGTYCVKELFKESSEWVLRGRLTVLKLQAILVGSGVAAREGAAPRRSPSNALAGARLLNLTVTVFQGLSGGIAELIRV
jgi:hypothetical protein